MKIDKNKLKRQKEGFEKWKNNNCLGSFQWVTGVGKGFTAILIAKKYIKKDSNFKVVVVVPTDPLRNDWREDANRHGISNNVTVDTVHSLVKEEISCDLLILDEIHMYVGEDAEVFPTIFEKIKADKILGLTATLGHDGIRRDIVDANCPVVDTIDLQEALDNNYISDYIQYNLEVPLTASERSKYNELDNRFYGYFKTFDYDFDNVKKILADRNYAQQFANTLGWDVGPVIGRASRCMKAIRERKNFLYQTPSKIQAAVDIINKFPNKKFITFGQTTDSADLVADKVEKAASFHSNIPTQLVDEDENVIGRKCGKGKYKLKSIDGEYSWDKIKQLYDGKITRKGSKTVKDFILKKFENNELKGLCTAKALDVGFDNADIELAVILAGSSNARQLIQRIGRAVRKKQGKRALIVQLYIPDTQDEKWLRKRQTNTSNVKHIVSISQITI